MLTGRFWLACVFPNLVDWLRLIDVRFSESLMWLVDFIGFVPRYLDSFVRFCPSYASWGLMELVGFRPSVSCRLPRRLRRFCARVPRWQSECPSICQPTPAFFFSGYFISLQMQQAISLLRSFWRLQHCHIYHTTTAMHYMSTLIRHSCFVGLFVCLLFNSPPEDGWT